MVTKELVEEIRDVVKNSLNEFGEIHVALFFKNADIEEQSRDYDLNNISNWKLIISVPWLKEYGVKKPLEVLSNALNNKLGERIKEIHLINFYSSDEPFIKEIMSKIDQLPANLAGINLPNVYIVEGEAFN